MGTVTISMIVLIILVIAFIGAGIWFKRLATSADDFLLAGRKAPFWLLATAYLGGYVGGASVSGYVGIGFTSGISGMWASLFVVSGCALFIVLFSRRLNYFGRKTGAVTIADFVCARYGESLRLPVAIVGFMRPGFLTGMQFLAIAVVMNIVFGTSIKIGVIASAAIILFYLITAGQYSALITQWFQSVLQSAGIILFSLAAFKAIGDPTTVTNAFYEILPENFVNFWAINPSVFTVYLLTLGLFYLVDPWIYMWSYIGESPKVSSNGMLAVLGGSYYNVLPFLAGMAILVGATTGKISVPEGLTGDALYSWFAIHFTGTAMGVVILVGLLMTIISCGSSFAMNGVTILTRDIYQKCINKKATDKQTILASRISLVVVVVIGIVSALWLPILVPLWVLAQAIGISGLFATTISAWFWRRSTTKGALASTICGGLAAFSWAMMAWVTTGSPGSLVYGLHAAHIGLLVSIPMMIIVSLATKPEYELTEATSYKVLGEEMKTTNLIREEDKQTREGIFGWLGAETSGWKSFWVVVFTIFALHYILSFFFSNQAMGLGMVWIAFVVGVVMIFMLTILGGRDIIDMVKSSKTIR
ncbi:sodium:solute symporter family protein [Sinanaerobacter chloroacetimidivorans]|uniref:Sodium:solute symporter family protein n=1 Tax=Sinanaerobacter chloroacetimidivorans TaxID=2818044 RepID=A0A8J7VXY9_9FIRM|nr:sodium:solute symporter family protein [Sinanaerobacter chloroacetimidivorans]MBR0597132.1 sodium:solute symporter family protein [Sinanaerobacter chloroacetimidivorans]